MYLTDAVPRTEGDLRESSPSEEEHRCSYFRGSHFSIAAADPGAATVTPLRGEAVSGKLLGITDQQVQIETASGPQTFAAAQLHSLQFSPSSSPVSDIAESNIAVRLVDGSVLAAMAFRVD